MFASDHRSESASNSANKYGYLDTSSSPLGTLLVSKSNKIYKLIFYVIIMKISIIRFALDTYIFIPSKPAPKPAVD